MAEGTDTDAFLSSAAGPHPLVGPPSPPATLLTLVAETVESADPLLFDPVVPLLLGVNQHPVFEAPCCSRYKS